ncbi:DUF732 domain-containing protein [Mycolicibacterium stellerae]|uniref:DUF732 domain-containing protein n=1 Tax=Mycolicibacterium stellerae TaxID=2358193 RepID=UPI000F0B7A47
MIDRSSTLAVAATVIAAGLSFAPAALADTTNDAFLNAINRANIPYADNNADLTAQLGQQVCPMLVEPGKSFAEVASSVADNGISPGMASFFTGIAISMYCPQMMGSIGNGTFLNSLQGLQGIPGVPQVPGF